MMLIDVGYDGNDVWWMKSDVENWELMMTMVMRMVLLIVMSDEDDENDNC